MFRGGEVTINAAATMSQMNGQNGVKPPGSCVGLGTRAETLFFVQFLLALRHGSCTRKLDSYENHDGVMGLL